MQEYFNIMGNAPDEAHLLFNSMFFSIQDRYNNDIAKAWSVLHPNDKWVRTLVIDSALMDALAPPEVYLGEQWEFEKACRTLQRLAQNRGIELQNVSALLSDLWPSLLRGEDSQGGWTSDTADHLEEELGLPKGTLRQLAKKAQRSLTFVKLGCCIRLDQSRLRLLKGHFEINALQGLFTGGAVCILDCQRIWRTAENLLRPNELDYPPPSRKRAAACMLGWVVWLHEQSHATRGTGGVPEEEVEAQLETYRMCDHTRFKSFGGFSIPGYPTYRQIMNRLAMRQPAPYRVIFTKAFQSALR
jgi:hypothetical protein